MQATRKTPYVCSACRLAKGAVNRRALKQHGDGLRYSTASAQRRPMRLAIIGSGPAGYYTAYRIMKKMPGSYIDMYESLPVPYGLVRFGVAPDHPEVKKSSENLDDVAKWPNFNFIGNVPIGDGPGRLPLRAIAEQYDALLFAYGASKDKTLGIPGEDLHGVASARSFVGWYNGLPEYDDLNPDLQSSDTAVIIGQGNVALDVARTLLAPIKHLQSTDMSEQAIDALSRSRVTNVKIIGRRGPLQAPYTIKELRELMHLPGTGFVPPPEGWDELIRVERKKLPRQLKRISELLEKGSRTEPEQAMKMWQLGFMRSPVEFLSSDGKGLDAIGFERTAYTAEPSSVLEQEDTPTLSGPPAALNALRALGVRSTGEKTLVYASLAFRSVGYKSESLPGFEELGIPFDQKRGTIPNDKFGRVLRPDRDPTVALSAAHLPGMYCAGWVKRGPTGVIASTMDDAFASADTVIMDWESNARFSERGVDAEKGGWDTVKHAVDARGIRSVSWADWGKIDAEERQRGFLKGKVREKMRSVTEMLRFLDA
ncbi:NADPH-adrenodoxin reductase [Oleoguttula sp. CCFEE 5521]